MRPTARPGRRSARSYLRLAEDERAWVREAGFYFYLPPLPPESDLEIVAEAVASLAVRDGSRVPRYAVRALDWMFKRPIFKSTDFIDHVDIPAPTARRILRLARDGGLLNVLIEGGGRRATIFMFPALLNIAEGKEAF